MFSFFLQFKLFVQLTQHSKTRGLYLLPVKCYNDLKTAYHAEKHAMYNAPTVSPSGSANSPVINIEETST